MQQQEQLIQAVVVEVVEVVLTFPGYYSNSSAQFQIGGAGGSGIVIVKELNKATGVWSLKSQFSAVKSGNTWPQTQCSVQLDYLVIAGGGGGGWNARNCFNGGGGGAGGFRTSFPGGTMATGSFYSGGSIPVTVGAGGAGGQGATGGTEWKSRGSLQYLEILHQQVVVKVEVFCGNSYRIILGGMLEDQEEVEVLVQISRPSSGGAGNTPPVSPATR
jgi:hypothetical protein